jgi:hypothetical protein
MHKLNDNINYYYKILEDDMLDLIHTIIHEYLALQYQILRDQPYDIAHMGSKARLG